MARWDRIDMEKVIARERTLKAVKGIGGRFRRPGNEPEKDLKIAIA